MSGTRPKNSGKTVEFGGSTIGFKFHANEEELEELQSEKVNLAGKSDENNIEVNSTENLNSVKNDEEKTEPVGDAVKDPWNLLGRRAASLDSNYESPFANPIETWRKLNELKEKITKTVEEKISDLSKSSKSSLLNSKENSSVSDSEENSESSKLPESWKDAEDFNSSPKKVLSNNTESLSSILENTVESVKIEMKNLEAESELRNRKTPMNISDLNNVHDIKIATAASEFPRCGAESRTMEGVDAGVEADETLNPFVGESVPNIVGSQFAGLAGSQPPTPPPPHRIQFVRLVKDLLKSDAYSQSWAVAIALSFALLLISPVPQFVKGFLVCLIFLKIWRMIKSYTFGGDDRAATEPFKIPDYKNMPPLRVPPSSPAKGVWVNEYERENYDPDYYSVTHTVPAYLEIDNNILKLSRPKGKIQRRATYDEPEYKLPFVSQRVYNIAGCNVYLMPEGLTRKRLFSKKYPVVIFLKPDSFLYEKKVGKGKELDERELNENVDLEEKMVITSESTTKTSLYLFARCDRQKQEWYRKLLAATRTSSNKKEKLHDLEEEKESDEGSVKGQSSSRLETSFFDDDEEQTEEYLRYMAKFIDEEYRHEIKYSKPRSSWYRKLKTKKKENHHLQESESTQTRNFPAEIASRKPRHSRTSEMAYDDDEADESSQAYHHVQWLNAFINRILFDIFRSSYWQEKIHEKLERKLNSIRLPFYVENIEIIEFDLGKTGPIFHRVSPPFIDDRGLWFDMDVTFDGLIKLTIQTHLNLIKLQKGVQEQEEILHAEKSEKLKKKRKDDKEAVSEKDLKKKGKEHSEKVRKSNSPKHSMKYSESHDSEHESLDDTELADEVAQLVEETLAEENLENEKEAKKLKKKSSKRSPIYDSEVEDSGESSDDFEEEEQEGENYLPLPPPESQELVAGPPPPRRYPKNRRSSKRFFRVFENVAQSKYFKSMAQSKYIQRAIAGVSATKLRLTVELKSLTGILSVNVPPPPTDRFWYGFREMPNLVFSANPKIGGKALRFAHIKNYLHRKILHELKKVMVIPNMIDFELPTSGPARSPSSLPTELPDLDDQEEATPSE